MIDCIEVKKLISKKRKRYENLSSLIIVRSRKIIICC